MTALALQRPLAPRIRIPSQLPGPRSIGYSAAYFGLKESNSEELNDAVFERMREFCEEVTVDVSRNNRATRASILIPAGVYDLNPQSLVQKTGLGLTIKGEGQSHSIFRGGAGDLLTLGNETLDPDDGEASNFAHVWVEDLGLFGDGTAGSRGVVMSRLVRTCGLRRCWIRNFETNIRSYDCWTIVLEDLHCADAGKNGVYLQTALGAEIRGGRYDDAEEDLIVIDGQGSGNQVRSFSMRSVKLQEASRRALVLIDVSSTHLDSVYVENCNQSNGAGNPVEDEGWHSIVSIAGTSNRQGGQLKAVNCTFSPGSAGSSWSKSEYCYDLQNLAEITLENDRTSSSAYNHLVRVGAGTVNARVDGAVLTNMTGDVLLMSDATTLYERWTKVNGAEEVLSSRNGWRIAGVRRDEKYLGMFGAITKSSANMTTRRDRGVYIMTNGTSQSLTIQTDTLVPGSLYTVSCAQQINRTAIRRQDGGLIFKGMQSGTELYTDGSEGFVIIGISLTGGVEAMVMAGTWAVHTP